MKDGAKNFSTFVNEQEMNANLRGFSASEIIKRMKFLSKVLPDNIQFGVPADFNGNSTTYKTLKEAIRRIQDLGYSYEKKNKPLTFYCWSITFNGSLEAEEALTTKMLNKGQLFHKNQKKYGKYNLAMIAKYFRDNPEDADNIKSLTLALDSSTTEPVESPETEVEEKPSDHGIITKETQATNSTTP